MGEKEKAIKEYEELYKTHKIVYSYCLERIEELQKPEAKLLNEFIMRYPSISESRIKSPY